MPYVIKMGSKKVSKRIPLIVPMTLCLVNATLTRSIIVLSLDFNKSKQKAEEILIELRWILVATCPLNVLYPVICFSVREVRSQIQPLKIGHPTQTFSAQQAVLHTVINFRKTIFWIGIIRLYFLIIKGKLNQNELLRKNVC